MIDRDRAPAREEARARLRIAGAARVLGIFPGSRSQEVRSHWPLFRGIAKRMLAEGRCSHAVVAATAGDVYPDAGPIEIIREEPVPIFSASDALLAKSGTTTLEAALAGTPMVVVYLSNRWTYLIARRLMTVHWISLVNLVAEREVVPEFWRRPVRAEPIEAALRPLLDKTSTEAVAQRAGLAEVRRRLGQSGAADRVAALAGELLAR